jgi:hypothetical protein
LGIGFDQSPRTFGNLALQFGYLAILLCLPLKMPFGHFGQTFVFFFITLDGVNAKSEAPNLRQMQNRKNRNSKRGAGVVSV